MSKNRLINRWKNINLTYTSKTEISCYVCDFNINIPSCKIYKDNDIFEAGELSRYQCPNCDVIFGDLRFLNMKIDEISEDYKDLYSYYQEGDTSNYILRVLQIINLGKEKKYLDYACGKTDKTLKLLNNNGYNTYGFDSYVKMNHPKFLSEINTNIKYDVVYSSNFIEHVINPFDDLNKLIDLLDINGKLVMISSCWEYCYSFTHYHTFFFIGRSVKYLCDKLKIKEIYSKKIYFDDNEFTTVKIFEKINDI
jgi:hypothetical protein